MAASRMRGERDGHTLRPTALIHEAYLRIGSTDQSARTPAEFLALAARAMRSVLVDYHRQRRRRPSDCRRVFGSTWSTLRRATRIPVPACSMSIAALTDLEQDVPQLAQLVEWRFFGGLSVEDCAVAAAVVRTPGVSPLACGAGRVATIASRL